MDYLKVWTNFREVMEPLNFEEKGRLFESMLIYAESGQEPESLEGNERFVWPTAKRDIDMAVQFRETKRQNGSKGGRPKTKENQEEPNETKENQEEPNETLKKRKEKKGTETKGNSSSINIVPLKRFVPPTVEEIKAYCDERGSYWIDPEHFVDYYEARGWILSNGKKMVDWKATVRTWEKNEKERQKQKTADDLPF